jgi:hypothetical protein
VSDDTKRLASLAERRLPRKTLAILRTRSFELSRLQRELGEEQLALLLARAAVRNEANKNTPGAGPGAVPRQFREIAGRAYAVNPEFFDSPVIQRISRGLASDSENKKISREPVATSRRQELSTISYTPVVAIGQPNSHCILSFEFEPPHRKVSVRISADDLVFMCAATLGAIEHELEAFQAVGKHSKQAANAVRALAAGCLELRSIVEPITKSSARIARRLSRRRQS